MSLARIRRIRRAREHPSTRWDVKRDAEGQPVTITEAQMWAILHALKVVEEVRASQGKPSLWAHPSPTIECNKSRLLGRMLLDGKPPFDDPPPTAWGACDYGAWDV